MIKFIGIVNIHWNHSCTKDVILSILTGMSLFILTACHDQGREAGGTSTNVSDQSGILQHKSAEIIVYGSKSCPHCIAFINEMDEEKISYTFKEVDNDDKNYQEMLDKIKSINFMGYVNYPVVDIGGNILVAPDFDQFIEFYRKI